jgi:NADH-quinone oxidoreductase subunit K
MDGDRRAPLMDKYQFLIALAVLTFAAGLAGVVIRRNLLVVVMCIEVMLNSVVLAFVTFAARSGTLAGAAMAFFIYIAAACEIAVAMAIVVMLVERRRSLDLAADYELKD